MKITPVGINFTANKMSKKQAEYFKKTLLQSQGVDILCHTSTDRDSANSAVVMYDYLKAKGVNSRIILSQNLKSLGLENKDYNIIQAKNVKEDDKLAPTVLCVDFSLKNRIAPNILNKLKDSKNVLCIDHHTGFDIADDDFIYLSTPMSDDEIPKNSASFYIDASAKSATSIIYRFFEAENENIDNKTAYNLFTGMCDDLVKKGYVVIDGLKGTITPTKKLLENKNALEVYTKLKSMLKDEQIQDITKKIDILSSLTPDEKKFNDSLHSRLKFSKNKKIAYVEIPPDDEEWKHLHGDNQRTSTILNRFRQNVLSNKFQDENLKDVQAVFVFYEARGNYRLSVHSKNDNILDYFKYIEDTTIPDFTKNAGGHPARAGGALWSLDKDVCHSWVQKIISRDEFFD